MIGSYPGSDINSGVATMKQSGTPYTGNRQYETSDAGVAGIESLYTLAGSNLQDGDTGIIDTGGTPIAFRYSDSAKNWIRLNPFSTSNACYFPEAAKTNGFRNASALSSGFTGSNYSYSAPDHILNGTSAFARVDSVDSVFSMSKVGFMVIHKVNIDVGATSVPIIDLRRDVSGSPYQNLRFQPAGGTWQISSVSTSNTGIAYAQGTDYSFEVYYDYATGRAWVYHDYSATPTAVANSAITLPTTTATPSALVAMNTSGIVRLEGFACGHLRTEL